MAERVTQQRVEPDLTPLYHFGSTPPPSAAHRDAFSQTSPNPAPHRLLPLDGPWVGGFESACHINAGRCRLDVIAATQHDVQAEGDYRRLREMGISAARDAVRWHLVERAPGRYDFATVEPIADAADRAGVQVIWNLCHYGWPDDLDLFSTAFVERFARYCGAVARWFADRSDRVPIYCLMNEVSFVAWSISDHGSMYPYVEPTPGEAKRQLIRAVIAGSEAVWAVDPRARLLQAEPLIRVFHPPGRPEMAEKAEAENASQYQAWDMLAGRCAPELGGRERYLDVIGLNYYFNNQWELPQTYMPWESPADPRRVPLHTLIAEVHRRYARPMLLSETSHFGVGRARWVRHVADEVSHARALGLPVEGVCLYPVIDRPDWEIAGKWHHAGLWDLVDRGDGQLHRVLHRPYADAVREAQRLLADAPRLTRRACWCNICEQAVTQRLGIPGGGAG